MKLFKKLCQYIVFLSISSSVFSATEILSPEDNSVSNTDWIEVIVKRENSQVSLISVTSDIDGMLDYYKNNQCTECIVHKYDVGGFPRLSEGVHTITLNFSDDASGEESSTSFSTKIENALPKVRILLPVEGQIYDASKPVPFLATAKDKNDMNIQNNLEWFVDGKSIGKKVGWQQNFPLEAGSHVIKVRTMDVHGAVAEDEIEIALINDVQTSDVIRIITHLNNEVTSPYALSDGESLPILLEAMIFTENNHEYTSNPTKITYLSSLDGRIGSNNKMRLNELSPGTHTITAITKNSSGNFISDSINLTLEIELPITSIVSPRDGQVFATGEEIVLEAYVNDIRGMPTQHWDYFIDSVHWAVKNKGIMYEGPYPFKPHFEVGVYEITVWAEDYQGNITNDTITFTVGEPVNSQYTVEINPVNPVVPFAAAPFLISTNAVDENGSDPSSNIFWYGLTGTSFDNMYGGTVNFYSNSGLHSVSASIYDEITETSVGDIVTFQIVNEKPRLKIVAEPGELNTDNNEVFFNLSAIVSDEETGLENQVNWFSIGETNSDIGSMYQIYNAADYEQRITAKVTDPDGKSGFANVQASKHNPLLIQQCESSGSNTDYEWMDSIVFHKEQSTLDPWGYPVPSQSLKTANKGYYDGTLDTSLTLYTGINQVTLSPGFKSAAYTEHWAVWIDVDNDGQFGENELLYTGSSKAEINTFINVPSPVLAGHYKMRIAMAYGAASKGCKNFTWGSVGDYLVKVISISSSESKNRLYCSAEGKDSTLEFINAITIGSDVRESKNNGGWFDATDKEAVSIYYGVNPLHLEPGFTEYEKTYPENWAVYIDYNRDNHFSQDETVYFGSGGGIISTEFTVPVSVKSGETRLRVIMSYGQITGPCDSFQWGEVEDYKINIQ